MPSPEHPDNYRNGRNKASWILGGLLLLALLVAGGLGYLYFAQKQSADTDKADLQSQVASLRSQLKTAQVSPSPSPSPVAPATLIVKEWKLTLAFPVNGTLTGLNYTYDAKADAVTFGSPDFEAKAAGCITTKGDFGIVSRITKGKAVTATAGTKIVTFGNFDYYSITPKAICGKTSTDEQVRINLRNAIIDAFQVATATQ